MKTALIVLLFFVLSLLMNVPWLGMTPLSGTEGHRALTANQMVHSGQWLVPILYGRAYLAKPPLHHWLIAISQTIAGSEDLFAWRMPSAIDGAILCAAACYFGIRWFGREAGIVSGGIALGMIALWGEHQVADIDATNTLAATLAALFTIEAMFGRTHARRAWIVAAGLAGGATWMTKGPAGLPIIFAVALFPAICEFRRKNVARALPANSGTASDFVGSALRTDWRTQENMVRSADPTRIALGYFGRPPAQISASRIVTAGNARPTWLRAIRRLKRPAIWAPLLIGAGIFALYALLVVIRLHHLNLAADLSGFHEGAKNLSPTTLLQLSKSLELPPTVFAYALPASMALPLSFWRPFRQNMGDGRRRRIAGAIAWAVLISWAICLFSGMTNPRYAYPTIGILCPLAGIVAVAGARAGGDPAHWVRGTAIVSAIGLAIASVVLSVSAWKYSQLIVPLIYWPLILSYVAAIMTAIWVFWKIRQSWKPAWGLVVLIVIVSVPFSLQRAYARNRDSGLMVADTVSRIVGPGHIAMGEALTFKPEIFYYAHTPATAYLEDEFNPDHVPPGTWLFIRDDEYARWEKHVGSASLKHTRLIQFPASAGPWAFYLTLYEPGHISTDKPVGNP